MSCIRAECGLGCDDDDDDVMVIDDDEHAQPNFGGSVGNTTLEAYTWHILLPALLSVTKSTDISNP
jgi:hypothetical protein